MSNLTRRTALTGALCALSGCSTLSTLNAASEPLNTYDLSPVSGSTTGRRTSRTLLVAAPQAPAVLATDRIMIKPDAVSVAYLPDARWGDEVPSLLQSLLIRSIAGAGRVGYVGPSGAGPVPDTAMLVRIDAFEVRRVPQDRFEVVVEIDLTLINDRDQSIIASRQFQEARPISDDEVGTIILAFQDVLDGLLPSMADWAIGRV